MTEQPPGSGAPRHTETGPYDDSAQVQGRLLRRARGEVARSGDLRLSSWQGVLAGLLLGWVAIAVKAMANEASGGDTGYIILLAACVLAAWFGGFAGGLTAAILTLTMNIVVFGAVIAEDIPAQVEQVRRILYLVIVSGTVALVATRRAGRDRLADALDEVAVLADEVEARDARLEVMLAASGTGFWEWDVGSGELTWSEAIFRQNGLDPAMGPPDFAGYLDLIHPDDRQAFQDVIDAALDGGSTFSRDVRVVRPDGTIHWIHAAGRVFRDAQGRPLRMIGTGQDVTERHRLQEQRDALVADERRAAEFREAFIDVVSHELRTPITTILGLTQILAKPGRTDDAEARTAMLEDVRAESERLHRLVEDLLVLSRVERGRLEVDAEPVQAPRLLRRIVAASAAELPSISIRLDVPEHVPVVSGEATYIDQVMRNLLGNAAKYTPNGTNVVVSIEPRGEEVEFRVRDDGPGISEASRAHLFDLFYRDPDSARLAAGSGIGLFVCRSLIEAMGGRIWVAEAPGGGAEFGFTLRRVDLDQYELAEAGRDARDADPEVASPEPAAGG